MKKHNGVKECVVQNFTMGAYRDCLQSGEPGEHCKMTTIQSKLLEIKTVTFTKKELSAFDDKKYYLDDKISLAHGHYRNWLINDIYEFNVTENVSERLSRSLETLPNYVIDNVMTIMV